MRYLAFFLAAAAAGQTAPGSPVKLEDPAINESSGLVASRTNAGIYWTHNDSGDGPFLYAFDREGHRYGRWRIPGARNIDWEDIAIGPAPGAGHWYLYIADIGDNLRTRRELTIYRIAEPKVTGRTACATECQTSQPERFRLRYPDGPHNAETLLVHPRTGDMYVVSKSSGRDPVTAVYQVPSANLGKRLITLRKIAELDIPDAFMSRMVGGIAGGDIAPGGHHVTLVDSFHLYRAEVAPDAAFDSIWRQRFTRTTIGIGLQVEGVCYTPDGSAILATTEGAPCRLYEVWRRD
jgi:hypothetical protein